ncbi:hypothetical protein DDZ13_10285 [Coraliomargarita sinensis]|uniref:Glycosyltransferase family 9 protein n=1 Tax=Coraliomargarita sinensis TaxID=2174842 RepID=A0A317ZE49_9BACT|nr:hypothetical protein DDZ13_10285 [Coraliomargarita sinensis]
MKEEGLFEALPDDFHRDPTLASTKAELNEVHEWLSRRVPSEAIGLVGVAIGSKMQAKVWPGENFRSVLETLWVKHRIWPIFIGGASDVAESVSIKCAIGAGAVAAGEFSIRTSLALLRQCCFYLGNDTGTMHLAVAAGLKCVAVFSARDQPGRWYPYGEGHFVHRKAVGCEGCMLLECVEQKKKCLTQITSEEVYNSCVKLLERENNK